MVGHVFKEIMVGQECFNHFLFVPQYSQRPSLFQGVGDRIFMGVSFGKTVEPQLALVKQRAYMNKQVFAAI